MTKQEALFKYLLRLADNHLILGHRLSELSSKGPMLEEDIAISNIALDLIGQSSALLQYAANVEGKGKTEDDLAFLRNERDFYNSLLVELPNKDFAFTIARQFIVSSFDYLFYDELKKSSDATLAGLAEKSHKEITYHLRHASKWMERLGDGTEESHNRLQSAIDNLWRYSGELFEMNEVDEILLKENIAVDLQKLKSRWEEIIDQVFASSTIKKPENVFMQTGSREGKHTEHLGYLLAEMQHLHRAFPGAQW